MYYSGNTYHQQFITLLIISFSKWALCDPEDYNIQGILQARTLEWVAFPFSRGSSQPRDRTQVSHIGGRCFTQIQPSECGVAECVCVCVCDGNRVGGGRRERGRTWAQVVVMRARALSQPPDWWANGKLSCCFRTDWRFNYSTAASVNHTREWGDNSQLVKIHTIAWQASMCR